MTCPLSFLGHSRLLKNSDATYLKFGWHISINICRRNSKNIGRFREAPFIQGKHLFLDKLTYQNQRSRNR